MKKSEGLQAIKKPLASLPHAIGKHIIDHIQKLTLYEPISLSWAKQVQENRRSAMPFPRGEVTPVSDVDASTRDVHRFRLSHGSCSLMIKRGQNAGDFWPATPNRLKNVPGERFHTAGLYAVKSRTYLAGESPAPEDDSRLSNG